MSTTEVARRFGVSRSTVAAWCRKGLLAADKRGRSWVIQSANRVIKTAAKVVQSVAEAIKPELSEVPLWRRYRQTFRGF